MVDKMPEYLYHYTSIETLALILKHHTFRFNSLCSMDDLTEEKSQDLQNFGRFVFISCWTDTVEESIPMWMMYAKRNDSLGGVRIKLPTFPFDDHIIKGYALRKVNNSDEPQLVEETRTTFYPLDLILNGYWPKPNNQDELLLQVEYTNDPTFIYPQVFSCVGEYEDASNYRLNFEPIGKYKPSSWAFQHEWRYRFVIFPQNLNSSSVYATRTGVALDPSEMIDNIIKGIAPLPFSHVDLELADFALANMEITLSPTISDKGREMVNTILEDTWYGISIKESVLNGTIRP